MALCLQQLTQTQELLFSVFSGNIGAVLEAGVKGEKSQCTSSKQSHGNSGSLKSSTMSSHVKRPVPRKACGDVPKHGLKLNN